MKGCPTELCHGSSGGYHRERSPNDYKKHRESEDLTKMHADPKVIHFVCILKGWQGCSLPKLKLVLKARKIVVAAHAWHAQRPLNALLPY